jgi:hypothetical protein
MVGQNGCAVFDFGRSKRVKGSYDFKSRWEMIERELPYAVQLVKGTKARDYSPANPVFRLPMECWKRLPLGVGRAVGLPLIRYVRHRRIAQWLERLY